MEFEKLGVSATAKVIKTVYNVLLNRYESVELGDAKSNLADTIVQQEQAIKEAPKKAMSMVAQAAENATQLITGNRGGYVVIHSSTGQSQPDEILIMDKPTIEEAVKVWRWNNSGLGYSENGYPGPYTSAWTIDGAFNADFITAGTISANLIKSGLLQSLNGMSSFDMDDGKIKIKLENGVEMEFSGEGFSFIKAVEAGDLTVLEHLGGINVFLNPGIGDKLYPTSKMSVYEVFDPEFQKVLGKFWDNGGTRSQLDTGGIYLRKENDMNTEFASLDLFNEAARFFLNQSEGQPWLKNFIDKNGFSICEVYDIAERGIGIQYGVAGGNGQFTVWSQGSLKGGMIASSDGAELRIGGGDSSYNMAWNLGEGSHLQADHHHFLGKSEGLITGRVSASDCSAYIVAMKPTSSGGYVSIIIPSDKADDSTLWQIADDGKFCNFTIDSSGNISFVNGTNVTGSALVYSIR